MIDWDWARMTKGGVDRLRTVLGRMKALAGMAGDDVLPETVTRRNHLRVLSMLRAAESALRRAIVLAMHGVEVAPASSGRKSPPSGPIPRGKRSGGRIPAFPLFDPRTYPKPPEPPKRRGRGPQFGTIGVDEFFFPSGDEASASPDDPVDASTLCRRILSLERALADVPKQARRLARVLASGKAKWLRPMRPGRPPGHRENGTRAVDRILADMQYLALWFLHLRKPP